MFAVSGVVHLVRPQVYEPIVPKFIPGAHEVVLVSGVAELVLAAGLLIPQTRKAAGYGSAALLAGVFPANVQMSVDVAKAGNKPLLAASLARLPMQYPMIKAALSATR